MDPDRAPNERSAVVSEEQMRLMLTAQAPAMRAYIAARLPTSVQTTVGAEDVLQDVWAAAFSQRAHFRLVSPSAFGQWSRKIMDRKLIDVKRQAYASKRGGASGFRRLVPMQLFSWSRLLNAGSPQTPSRALSTKETAAAIETGLNELPEDVRKAVVMHDLQGRPLDEVARSMNRSSSTLRGMLHRGRSRLRDLLGDPRRFFSESGVVVKKDEDAQATQRKSN